MVKTLIRKVSDSVYTFARPFSRFGILKIGARSTVLILRDGSLAIISPISLREDSAPLDLVRDKLHGNVKLIIAPDLAHWLSVAEWKKEFPAAKLIGVEGHDRKTRKDGLKWDTLFTAETVVAHVLEEYGLQGDLKFCYFAGFVGKDLVTLHEPSRTIVEADLLFNLPAKEQYSGKVPGGLTSLMNCLHSDSEWSRRFLWYIGCKNEKQMQQAAATVRQWDFDTLIPCHGELVVGDAKSVWNWTFSRFLN